MLSLTDAWIKAAVEQKTLKIVYVKANSVHETIREVAPSFAGWSQNMNTNRLWGYCYLRDQIRCFKPERIWRWQYIGNAFQPREQIQSELTLEYRQKQLQTCLWNENLGEDFGYQQFIDLESSLIIKALNEIKGSLLDQNLTSHPLIPVIDQYLSQPSRDQLTNSNLVQIITIYLDEAINSADSEAREVLEIIKQRINDSPQ